MLMLESSTGNGLVTKMERRGTKGGGQSGERGRRVKEWVWEETVVVSEEGRERETEGGC